MIPYTRHTYNIHKLSVEKPYAIQIILLNTNRVLNILNGIIYPHIKAWYYMRTIYLHAVKSRTAQMAEH
jgi:hypothetical protein